MLESLGIRLAEVRARVTRIIGQGDEVTTGQIPFTPHAKNALELALREARCPSATTTSAPSTSCLPSHARPRALPPGSCTTTTPTRRRSASGHQNGRRAWPTPGRRGCSPGGGGGCRVQIASGRARRTADVRSKVGRQRVEILDHALVIRGATSELPPTSTAGGSLAHTEWVVSDDVGPTPPGVLAGLTNRAIASTTALTSSLLPEQKPLSCESIASQWTRRSRSPSQTDRIERFDWPLRKAGS